MPCHIIPIPLLDWRKRGARNTSAHALCEPDRLERELSSDLKHSWIISGRAYRTDTKAANLRSGYTKLHTVEDVEGFHPQFE